MFDGGSMEFPWRFDVDYMDFSGMFWRSSQFPSSGPIVLMMQVWWRFHRGFHGGSMEVPWSFDVDYTHVQVCFEGPIVWTMQVPWRFHWRFDVDYMDFPGMFWRSCHFPSSGSVVLIMQVWWRFHGVSMEV